MTPADYRTGVPAWPSSPELPARIMITLPGAKRARSRVVRKAAR